jgi:hypothetical protein
MSNYPGLLAGTGLLPLYLAESIARVAAVFGDPAGGQTEYGTGFLVRRKDGSSYLATAAHVLFKTDFDYPRQVTIWLGQRGGSCAKAVTVMDAQPSPFFVPEEFKRQPLSATGSDYGLVRIDDPGGTLLAFHHFIASSAAPVQNVVRLYGYPKNNDEPQSGDPYYTILEAVPEGSECFSYAHVPDQPGPSAPATYKGMSGGPLIGNSTTDKTDRVFGIHTRGGTDIRAVRMSDKVRAAMKGWIG